MDFGVMWWQCANEKWEVEAAGVVLAGRLEQHHSMPRLSPPTNVNQKLRISGSWF